VASVRLIIGFGTADENQLLSPRVQGALTPAQNVRIASKKSLRSRRSECASASQKFLSGTHKNSAELRSTLCRGGAPNGAYVYTPEADGTDQNAGGDAIDIGAAAWSATA